MIKKLILITLAFLFVLMAVNLVSAANSTANLNSQSTIPTTESIVVGKMIEMEQALDMI